MKLIYIIFMVLTIPSLGGCDSIVNSLLFEKHTVLQGNFRGLQIGSSKKEMLQEIKNLGVYAVLPIPSLDFKVSRTNLEKIEMVKKSDGIRVTNNQGLAIDIYFKDGVVNMIRRSVPAQTNRWFREKQTLDEVITTLRTVLDEDRGLVVFPIVFYEGDGWIVITGTLEQPLQTLSRYDAWTFGLSTDKPGGSNFDLYFKNDRLVRIEYRRAKVRLD